MMIGLVQPGTRRGTFLQMIGSRKMQPPRMLRMVPFGDFHISFRPNSFTRASSGVMVAHLTPTPTFLMALAASIVTCSLDLSRYSIPRSKYIRFTSRKGLISLSLMYCQMIRVISSPSSSTTGLVTLIFAMTEGAFLENRADSTGLRDYVRAIALQTGWRKPSRYAVSAQFLDQNTAWVAVPATTYQVTNRPQISAPGRLEPVRRQVKVATTAQIANSGTNWMATMVESGTNPGSGSGLK